MGDEVGAEEVDTDEVDTRDDNDEMDTDEVDTRDDGLIARLQVLMYVSRSG